MIAYTELPSSITEGKCYLSVSEGQNSLIQRSPIWTTGSFSKTNFVYPLFTNASLQGRLILIGYKR
jgi:hypothetical protein